jgi:hypothetical protein
MDFGRITLDQDLILYLFGTPGQDRFWFMWDELVRGAIGAVVMVDTRRLADCFAAIDFFEHRRLTYLVAINCFDGGYAGLGPVELLKDIDYVAAIGGVPDEIQKLLDRVGVPREEVVGKVHSVTFRARKAA